MNSPSDLLSQMNLRSPKWARNPIIAGYRGSHAHGTYIPPEDEHGTDDIDTFGVVVHPRSHYLGLDGYRQCHATFNSNMEDLDIETHEIQKYVFLLAKGNPNVHQHLWLEPGDYFVITRPARILLTRRRDFLSQRMFQSFAGYAYAQLHRMTKFEKRGYMGTKREGIVKKHGYDIKNAAHCIRLLYCGIHLAEYGEVIVRLPSDPHNNILEMVLGIKRGLWKLEQVQSQAKRMMNTFDTKREANKHNLPERLEFANINKILQDVIETQWEEIDQ